MKSFTKNYNQAKLLSVLFVMVFMLMLLTLSGTSANAQPQLPLLTNLTKLNLKVTDVQVLDDVSGNDFFSGSRTTLKSEEGYKLIIVTLKGSVPNACRITLRSNQFSAIYETASSDVDGKKEMEPNIKVSVIVAKDKITGYDIPASLDTSVVNTFFFNKPSPVNFKVVFSLPAEVTSFHVLYPAPAEGRAIIKSLKK